MTVISYYRNLQLISTGVLGGVKASKRHNKPNSQEGGLTIGARRAFISERVIIGFFLFAGEWAYSREDLSYNGISIAFFSSYQIRFIPYRYRLQIL